MTHVNKTREQLIQELSAEKERVSQLREEVDKLHAETVQRNQIEIGHIKRIENLEAMINNNPKIATYQLIVDHDNDPHTSRAVSYTSRNFTELTGITEPQSPDSWFENVHPDDIELIVAAQEKALSSLKFEVTYRSFFQSSQEWRWYHAISVGTFDASGALRYFNGMIMDVTEAKRTENRMLAYQERLRAMAAKISEAVERERKHIAGVLHDRVGQSLFAAKWEMQRLASTCQTGLGIDESVLSVLEEAIADTRSLTAELYPRDLYEFGLEHALKKLVEAFRKRYGLNGEFSFDGQIDALNDKTRIIIYRAVSELLNNVAKHAQADTVSVRLSSRNGDITVSVSDDGIGLEPGMLDSAHLNRFGLFSINERLAEIGGQMQIEESENGGAKVTLTARSLGMEAH